MLLNDVHYNCTPTLAHVLEDVRARQIRIKIEYADGSAHFGFVRTSSGPMRVPILLYSPYSRGGCAVDEHRIIQVNYSRKEHGGALWSVVQEG